MPEGKACPPQTVWAIEPIARPTRAVAYGNHGFHYGPALEQHLWKYDMYSEYDLRRVQHVQQVRHVQRVRHVRQVRLVQRVQHVQQVWHVQQVQHIWQRRLVQSCSTYHKYDMYDMYYKSLTRQTTDHKAWMDKFKTWKMTI